MTLFYCICEGDLYYEKTVIYSIFIYRSIFDSLLSFGQQTEFCSNFSPLFPYTKECWISLYGVKISTDMVTQDEARKYAADYFSSITLPYFGETERNELYFPKFDEETYLYTDAVLCYPHDNDHGLDNLTVVLCQEPKMTWRLDYGFEGSTGAFFVWVDAFTGEVLKYSAILAD